MTHGERLSRRTLLKLTAAATAAVSGCNFFDSDGERSEARTTVGYGSSPAGTDNGTSIGTGASRDVGRSMPSTAGGGANGDGGVGANAGDVGDAGGPDGPTASGSEPTDREVWTPDSELATLTEIGTSTPTDTETPTSTETASETATETPVSTTEAPRLYNAPDDDEGENEDILRPTDTATQTPTATQTATETATQTPTGTPTDDYGDVGYGQMAYGSPAEQ